MIVYNVTIKVHNSIATQWLLWLQQEHVQHIMETNCFTSYKILQLLEVDDEEGPTYTVQYFADSKALYNNYVEKYAAKMKQESFDAWGDKFIAFRSVMKIVE